MKSSLRTFVFGLLGLVFLVLGLWLCLIRPTAGVAVFASFAMAVVTIVAAIATKHSVDSLALGSGVQGVWKALTTSAQPQAPAPPAPPPTTASSVGGPPAAGG